MPQVRATVRGVLFETGVIGSQAPGRAALRSRLVDERHCALVGVQHAQRPALDPRLRPQARPQARAPRPSHHRRTGRNVALPRKKKRKRWIWKALCRHTRRLLDWQIGRRDSATLQKLLTRLKAWNITAWRTDGWESYAETLPAQDLVQSKRETVTIEQNNSQQRHWIGRFRRRTQIISRSTEMIDLTIALFNAYHIDRSLPQLSSLLL